MSGLTESKEVGRDVFVFNPQDNSGEELILTTIFCDNGDETNNIYTVQELMLTSSYSRSLFLLYGSSITPDMLRKAADQMEEAIKKFDSERITE